MSRHLWPLVFAVAVLVPRPTDAQTRLGARGYVTYGGVRFAATETIEKIGGAPTQRGAGGGGSVTGLWRGLFADVSVSQESIKGERVFIDGTNVYRLGIPLRVTVRPVDVAAGWRFGPRRLPRPSLLSRLSTYAGAGVSVISYKEHADFALAGDDVRDSANGGVLLAGIDVSVMKFVFAGGEVRYRFVQGVLGKTGVSQLVGDDQLGGVSFALRISAGR